MVRTWLVITMQSRLLRVRKQGSLKCVTSLWWFLCLQLSSHIIPSKTYRDLLIPQWQSLPRWSVEKMLLFTVGARLHVSKDLTETLLSHYFHLPCTCSPQPSVCVLLCHVSQAVWLVMCSDCAFFVVAMPTLVVTRETVGNLTFFPLLFVCF